MKTNEEIKSNAIESYLQDKPALAIDYFSEKLPDAVYQPTTDRFVLAGESFWYKKLCGVFVLYNPFEEYNYIYDLLSYGEYLVNKQNSHRINTFKREAEFSSKIVTDVLKNCSKECLHSKGRNC